jgi:hypothetical protein
VTLPHAKRPKRNTPFVRRVPRAMKQLAQTIVVMVVIAACGNTPSPTPSNASSSPSHSVTTPSPMPTSTAFLATTAAPTLIARCIRQGNAALAGVVEARPDGWSGQGEIGSLPGSSNTYGQVYGPNGVAVPPFEGPGRLALYETAPASDAYFTSRIEQSRTHGGRPLAVTVCGEATEVWRDDSTGELVVGWTDRDKRDVLVANSADFTVQDLIDAAESVYDCCG